MWDDRIAYDPLTHRAEATPGRTALVDAETGEASDYESLDGRVGGVAARLRRLGLGERDHLGVVMGTRTEFLLLVHASMRLNAVLVPVNARLERKEIKKRLEAADASAVVCDSETEAKVKGTDAVVATIDDASSGDTERVDLGTESVSGSGGSFRVPRSVSETACIPFTSGTTGDPKPVRLSYTNFLASATASAFRLGHLPGDRRLVCLPMYHMGGLSHVFRSTLHGTASVVREGFDAKGVIDEVVEYGITQVSLVPTMMRRILDTGRASELDRLRYVLLGGAPATDELLRDCAEEGVSVSPTYGMTEAASQVATVAPGRVSGCEDPKEVGVGPPLVSARVSILDDEEVLSAGETGDVAVSGPTVTEGYYGMPEETRGAFCEYGLVTGDVGYKDETGRLHILGRKDDLILTGGEKVRPDEVAEVILGHPSVEDAAVLGVEDPEWGERVCALVVLCDGDEVDIEGYCSERLAGYKRPRTVVSVDEIPRTPSGTVEKDAARDIFG
jgi:O-succinylbenzoic acid--CoA ligase